MGFSPRQVDEMSLWEFVACADGYAEAHGGKKKRKQRSAEPSADIADLRALGIMGA